MIYPQEWRDEYWDWFVKQPVEVRRILPGIDNMLAVMSGEADLSDFLTVCQGCRLDCKQCHMQPIERKTKVGELPDYRLSMQ